MPGINIIYIFAPFLQMDDRPSDQPRQTYIMKAIPLSHQVV
jgi:hypothetical protein